MIAVFGAVSPPEPLVEANVSAPQILCFRDRGVAVVFESSGIGGFGERVTGIRIADSEDWSRCGAHRLPLPITVAGVALGDTPTKVLSSFGPPVFQSEERLVFEHRDESMRPMTLADGTVRDEVFTVQYGAVFELRDASVSSIHLYHYEVF